MSRMTTGWLARHTPQGPGGRQAALIDIAQDLLLARLCERGVFDHLVFKGGTALRKLRLPVHAAYELPPAIPVMSLAENMAEKIARLTRRTPARDVYDLVWISSTSPHSSFDRALARRLAVLKNWVDQHGLSSPPAIWRPVTGAVPFNADRWHATRHAADFDEDSIGILAVPPPSLDALGDQLRRHFGFLADLDGTEQRIVTGGAGSRNLVLEAIGSLPGSRFTSRPLY